MNCSIFEFIKSPAKDPELDDEWIDDTDLVEFWENSHEKDPFQDLFCPYRLDQIKKEVLISN